MLDDFKVPKKKPIPKIPTQASDINQPEEKKLPEPDIDIDITMDDKDKMYENDDHKPQRGTEGTKVKRGLVEKITGWWRRQSPKKKRLFILLIIVLIILIALGGFFTYKHFHKHQIVKPVAVKIIKKVTIDTVASRLTGVQVSPSLAALPVTAVMIENSDEARPQSGLSQAGVIFEAEAEGGITRFMALYEEGQPSSIGPIRSARPYYVDWMLPFDAGYSHVGGSADALTQIQTDNVRDMNQFYNSSSYERISSREAPHNVYTSMSNLLALEKSKGWTSSTFTGFPRKADQPSKKPTTTKINFSMEGSADYEVNYTYDSSNNSYLRSEGGTSQIDANTNQQLDPKVVIAIVVPQSQGALDATGAYYTDYQDIGSGQDYVFQDGTVTIGTWQKSSATSQIQFDTTSGSPVDLNAGQTWITAVGESSDVTYSN